MKKIIKNKKLPTTSKYLNHIKSPDFFDSYSITLHKNEDIKELYLKGIVNSLKWIEVLMKLRNSIVKAFGLTTVDKINKEYNFTIGEKVGMFTLYYLDEKEIITGEKDSHLDFCVSFLKEGSALTVSTVVHYNNTLGKIYFFFVKPFHSFIVKNMIKKYIS